MKNSKIILMLNQLSSKQKADFTDFVDSPFFNKNKNLSFLLQYLLHAKEPTFEEASRAVSMELKLKREYLLNLMSKLVKLFDQFISTENILNHTFNKEFALIEAYDEMGMNTYFTKKWQKLIDACEDKKHSRF